jgi:hypothetical protein
MTICRPTIAQVDHPVRAESVRISCSGSKIRIQIFVGARHQIIDLGKEFRGGGIARGVEEPLQLTGLIGSPTSH